MMMDNRRYCTFQSNNDAKEWQSESWFQRVSINPSIDHSSKENRSFIEREKERKSTVIVKRVSIINRSIEKSSVITSQRKISQALCPVSVTTYVAVNMKPGCKSKPQKYDETSATCRRKTIGIGIGVLSNLNLGGREKAGVYSTLLSGDIPEAAGGRWWEFL